MKQYTKTAAAAEGGFSIKNLLSKACCLTKQWKQAFLFAFGVALLTGGIAQTVYAVNVNVDTNNAYSWAEPKFNETLIRGAVGNLFRLIEGAFGALVMVVAGLGAIIAAAMGAYRAAVGMLVVAIGAFILRSLVSLFFGNNYPAVSTQIQAGQNITSSLGAQVDINSGAN